jgi:hypothetical protein
MSADPADADSGDTDTSDTDSGITSSSWGPFVRPAEDFALYRADMAAWPGAGKLREWQVFNREWVAASDACRRDIHARLAACGLAAWLGLERRGETYPASR